WSPWGSRSGWTWWTARWPPPGSSARSPVGPSRRWTWRCGRCSSRSRRWCSTAGGGAAWAAPPALAPPPPRPAPTRAPPPPPPPPARPPLAAPGRHVPGRAGALAGGGGLRLGRADHPAGREDRAVDVAAAGGRAALQRVLRVHLRRHAHGVALRAVGVRLRRL